MVLVALVQSRVETGYQPLRARCVVVSSCRCCPPAPPSCSHPTSTPLRSAPLAASPLLFRGVVRAARRSLASVVAAARCGGESRPLACLRPCVPRCRRVDATQCRRQGRAPRPPTARGLDRAAGLVSACSRLVGSIRGSQVHSVSECLLMCRDSTRRSASQPHSGLQSTRRLTTTASSHWRCSTSLPRGRLHQTCVIRDAQAHALIRNQRSAVRATNDARGGGGKCSGSVVERSEHCAPVVDGLHCRCDHASTARRSRGTVPSQPRCQPYAIWIVAVHPRCRRRQRLQQQQQQLFSQQLAQSIAAAKLGA